MGIHATRRQMLAVLGALCAAPHRAFPAPAANAPAGDRPLNRDVEYGRQTLPPGIRSRRVDNNNGLRMHILEAGFEAPRRPCVVLLHGFPELAYTWRHQLLPLAHAGYHVIAPDLRGYGRTAPRPVRFDQDLVPYAVLNRVSDVLGLVRALGFAKVAAVVGHDWGSPTAAWCALVRPDVFGAVVLMSTPFDGPEALPLGTADAPLAPRPEVDIQRALAALPRPRQHYWWYSAGAGANENMWHAPQGVHDLLRAMFHFKSADWPGNQPFALRSWTAAELARLPTYYVMDRDQGIAETMAAAMPSAAQIAACHWMTEDDLAVYSAEYQRTGFQGGLNAYRILTTGSYYDELKSFTGRVIEVPACFIGGVHDWGVRQSPGAFEGMQRGPCARLLGVHLVDGAGHSIPEEQPAIVNRLLLEFLRQADMRPAPA